MFALCFLFVDSSATWAAEVQLALTASKTSENLVRFTRVALERHRLDELMIEHIHALNKCLIQHLLYSWDCGLVETTPIAVSRIQTRTAKFKSTIEAPS